MAGQTTDSGLMVQAIRQYFSHRLFLIPVVALLVVMAVYVALGGNGIYAGATGDNEINLGQEPLEAGNQQGEGFALGTQDTSQGNDKDIESTGTQGGYSNASAMTASYVDWGGQDNGILSAFLGHLKKTLPEARGSSADGHVVLGASEA